MEAVGSAVSWYLAIQSLTLPGALILSGTRLPATTAWALGKLLALLTLAALVWFLAAYRLLPAAPQTVLALTVIAWIVALAIVSRRSGARLPTSSVVGVETVFLIAFGFWALVRSFDPAAATTEKPMDLLFFTAVQAGGFFPPPDPWMGGLTISYYYLGFVMAALPGLLAGVGPAVGFNLALAATAAFAATLAVAAIRLLVAHGVLAPLLAVGAVTVVGNGLALFEFLRAWRLAPDWLLQWVAVEGLTQLQGPATAIPTDYWWWWRSTRLINTQLAGQSVDYTITEYPLFSFILGDLHPHVMTLPVVLGSITLALWALQSGRMAPGRLVTLAALSGLLAGAVALMNTWDAPTVLVLLLAGLGLPAVLGPRRLAPRWLAIGMVAALVSATVPFIPFYLTFATQASGIGLWLGPGTRPLHYLLFWGVFLIPIGAWLWLTTEQLGRWRLVLLGVPLLAMVAVELLRLVAPDFVLGQAIVARLWLLGPLAALLLLARPTLMRRDALDMSVWFLVFAGVGLQIISEWLFIRDVFNTRMNTVFKLYYQTWPLWGLAAVGSTMFLIGQANLRVRRPVLAMAGAAASLALAMGGAGIYSRTLELGRPSGLDATAFIEAQRPGEGAAIGWLRSLPAGTIVLEAVGPGYSEFGRLSMASGISTVLGWPGHQRQWRGEDPRIGERERAVEQIYSAPTLDAVSDLLRQYDVRYVAVGDAERRRYGQAGLQKFDGWPAAFRDGTITIVEVPR